MPSITYTWKTPSPVGAADPNYEQFASPINWTPNGVPGATATPGNPDIGVLTGGTQLVAGTLDNLALQYAGAAADNLSVQNFTFGANFTFAISGAQALVFTVDNTAVNNGVWTVGANGVAGQLTLQEVATSGGPATFTNAGAWNLLNGSSVNSSGSDSNAVFDNAGTLSVASGAGFFFGSRNGPDGEALRNEGAINVTGAAGVTTFLTDGGTYVGGGVGYVNIDGGTQANFLATKMTFASTVSNLSLTINDASVEFNDVVSNSSVNFGNSVNLYVNAVLNANANPFGAALYGFNASDAVDVNRAYTSFGYDPASGRFTLFLNGVANAVFVFGGPAAAGYTTASFNVRDVSNILGGSNTEITLAAACYAAGTMIAVPGGEVPIETIAIGDLVRTAAGPARPVRWIGRRRYAGRFMARNPGLQPVLFRQGALGAGLPRRDLRVSPSHAMLIDNVLVPASLLVNGTTIVHETHCRAIDYVHLELPTHDAILAEGAASESFVDDDSRGVFHNAADYAGRYPDAPRVPARYCAPRLTTAPERPAILAA